MRRRRAKVDVGAGYPVQRLRLLQDRLRQRRIEGGDESGIIGNEERIVIVRRQQAVRIEERDEVRSEIRNEVRNENRNQGTSQNGVEELRLKIHRWGKSGSSSSGPTRCSRRSSGLS